MEVFRRENRKIVLLLTEALSYNSPAMMKGWCTREPAVSLFANSVKPLEEVFYEETRRSPVLLFVLGRRRGGAGGIDGSRVVRQRPSDSYRRSQFWSESAGRAGGFRGL